MKSIIHFDFRQNILIFLQIYFYWGRSSAGRAPEWHSGGHEFDPRRLHKKRRTNSHSLVLLFFHTLKYLSNNKYDKIFILISNRWIGDSFFM